ncbi:tetratricopeptide repeat protein [Candidatus Halocynthiibacter alkanivorans]|uniref:tetratricopeptide repeat protein n=1 Tax=Candidatus Halocynthiibacter alkanivorans TaxID=2267619 RepID=UPI000DF464FB|nr:tetratricopeptide repeat protein [Candidatus Halocynthiibacter alkanivorans]
MDYFDLGTHSRKITTTSPEAQLWFDRGLIWTFAYNHEEAITCFQKALEADPDCAMAHWGIGYATGPNYNKPWESFEPEEKPTALALAQASAASAERLKAAATAAEKALIEALPHRCPPDPEVEDFSPWNDRFAAAMREAYRGHPQDTDICCLFAESLMNRTPWQLWDLPTGTPAAGAATLEAVGVLETALERLPGAWQHPGLLHMYIHLMEMSPHPERALRHGDRLHSLVPDAGHLLHMATHIDVLCGDYQQVVSRNQTAVVADRKFLAYAGSENFYSVYRCHNYHFIIYGAMLLGQPGPALDAAEDLISNLPADTLRPMADWFEAFIPMKQHVLIRFGLWQDILDQPLPDEPELYAVTTAMMHYARTVALANLGDIAGAEAERDLFAQAFDRVPESRMLFNNTCRDILQVAEQMLLGELAYKKGNPEVAFDHLRRSVALDDTLPYDEPWGWMQPTRHALGALLLDQKRYDEAETVYRADLGLDASLSRACQHPANVWSLHGLHECLAHRGENLEIVHIRLQLDRAMARAEVPIRASCFCRG